MPEIEFLDYNAVTHFGWQWDDSRLFQKAAAKDLQPEKHGSFQCGWDQYILEAAEHHGYDWSFSCRAGACTDCAAILVEGEVDMEMQQILSDPEIEEQNVRLTCISTPQTETVKLIINARLVPTLQNRVIGDYDDSSETPDQGLGDLFGPDGDQTTSETEVYNETSETRVYDGHEENDLDNNSDSTASVPTNYCPDCGQDLSALEDPQFCPGCGFEMP